MGRINLGRVILAGLVAGLIINLIGLVGFGFLLGDAYEQAMAPRNVAPPATGQMAAIWVVGFAAGIVVAWIYAAIRPRFGPGFQTALTAGLVVWVVGRAFPAVVYTVLGIFPANLALTGLLLGLIQLLLAGWAAGYLYQEEAEAPKPVVVAAPAAGPPPDEPTGAGPTT